MENDELNVFARRLKQLRLSLNMTQKEFADKVDLTASALSAYENNIKNPSVAVAKRIAEKFSISIDWLCGLSDKMTSSDDIISYSDAIRAFDKLDEAFSIKINIADLAGGALPQPILNTPKDCKTATFQVARLHTFFVVVLQNNVVLLRNVTERFATLRSDRIKVLGGLRVHTRQYSSVL